MNGWRENVMKDLLILGGPMGVGKTTVGQLLKHHFDRCVFLDGDWCWDTHPFLVTEETKKMVVENIVFLLNQFIKCNDIQTIIFVWVLHEQFILDSILSKLQLQDCQVHSLSLICSPDELRKRTQQDVGQGIRSIQDVERGMERIPYYQPMKTTKIDVTNETPYETMNHILCILNRSNKGPSKHTL